MSPSGARRECNRAALRIENLPLLAVDLNARDLSSLFRAEMQFDIARGEICSACDIGINEAIAQVGFDPETNVSEVSWSFVDFRDGSWLQPTPRRSAVQA